MFGVNDIFNQNKAFSRSTGSGFTQNSWNSVIGRYFIAQFNCTDNFEFPATIQEITGVNMRMFYENHFGDPDNAMRLQVDTLDKVIPEKELGTFYTSVDPTQYYDASAKPVARRAYAAHGASVNDSTVVSYNSYGEVERTYTYYWQDVKLPLELGQHMYDKYKEDKSNYKDAESFIKNVLKGFYVHCTHGDGTILYISDIQLRLNFKYLIESSSGKVDSLINGSTIFAATKEVIQANRFQNSERLKELVEETFIGANYNGDDETEKELSNLLGGKWRCYDTKIDDGVDDDETEDEYIMVSCFENEQGYQGLCRCEQDSLRRLQQGNA